MWKWYLTYTTNRRMNTGTCSQNGFWGEDCIICISGFPMKILAYEGAIVVHIAVLLICIICSPLNVKLLCFSMNVSNWTRLSVGDSLTALWSSRTNISMLTIPVKMVFDIYNKPTDEHRYLFPQSCHTKHFTKSIPYSQALRIKWICSRRMVCDDKWHSDLLFEFFSLYWMRSFLSIPLALLKQWLMLALL
jgi:hypothetical protein